MTFWVWCPPTDGPMKSYRRLAAFPVQTGLRVSIDASPANAVWGRIRCERVRGWGSQLAVARLPQIWADPMCFRVPPLATTKKAVRAAAKVLAGGFSVSE